ncbi:HAMP domain-containing sensor histidine kinase [Lyngbya sp. PCC 8106]|uniref:sensor histidine kinase n=1 Tax=Lyngbya sp. (strain PCC 8106) TaxID=313612 RepID=UPI000587FF33
MTVNQLLPTISEILARQGLESSLDFYQNTVPSGGSSPYTVYYASKQQLKAEREWCGAIKAIHQLLRQLIIQQGQERSRTSCSEVRKKDLTHATGRETLTEDRPPPQLTTPPVSHPSTCQGLVLSGPSPVLVHPALALNFATQVFVPQIPDWEEFSIPTRQRLSLLPSTSKDFETSVPPTFAFPLLRDDPQANEPFCIVLTSRFSLVMVLGEDAKGCPAFQFSFDPDVVEQALELLRRRSRSIRSQAEGQSSDQLPDPVKVLDRWIEQFPLVDPNYKTVMQFSRLLLENLPLDSEKPRETMRMLNPASQPKSQSQEVFVNVSGPQHSNGHLPHSQTAADGSLDASQVELIQAISHEVRTPLATIRTLTRLLLKRQKFDPEIVRKRLEMIDHECTTQIDRFNLIFRAVELELSQTKQASDNKTQKPSVQLTPMSLGDILQSSLPRWQKQATQRNHTLEVNLPQKLPHVVSDPTMLDQVLTGVIENFTRSLPSGSHIQVEVRLAGHQLKLQLESQSKSQQPCPFGTATKSSLKSIGRLLMFQPETGALSLNMAVTKNLFEALGGKLVVRQRSQQGKVMTIFLPLKS